MHVLGTHDVKDANLTIREQITVKTTYIEQSMATGALFIIVPYINGAMDSTRAVHLALDKIDSRSYEIPFSLRGERIAMFVYDIESDGTLTSGVGFPAVHKEVAITGSTQGKCHF